MRLMIPSAMLMAVSPDSFPVSYAQKKAHRIVQNVELMSYVTELRMRSSTKKGTKLV